MKHDIRLQNTQLKLNPAFHHLRMIKSSRAQISVRQTYLLGVQDNLGELTSLCEALDDFVGNIGPQVDTESQGGIHCLHQVTQLL